MHERWLGSGARSRRMRIPHRYYRLGSRCRCHAHGYMRRLVNWPRRIKTDAIADVGASGAGSGAFRALLCAARASGWPLRGTHPLWAAGTAGIISHGISAAAKMFTRRRAGWSSPETLRPWHQSEQTHGIFAGTRYFFYPVLFGYLAGRLRYPMAYEYPVLYPVPDYFGTRWRTSTRYCIRGMSTRYSTHNRYPVLYPVPWRALPPHARFFRGDGKRSETRYIL